WWIRLGIAQQRIQPSHPEQNGAHERMHRTLRAETTRPPAYTRRGQQRRFHRFRAEYNHERPHEALGQQPPATVWRPSPRPYPRRLPHPEYPGHHLVRLVSNAGTFRFKAQQLFLSQALKQDYIGLEETADGVWSIYFYDVLLGKLHELAQKLFDLSAFLSCLESVHGRAIEPSEPIDEFRGANLGRHKGVGVLEHGDLLLGHSRLTKAFDDVALHTPGHRADEAFRR